MDASDLEDSKYDSKFPLQTRPQAMKSFKTIERIHAPTVWNKRAKNGYNNQDAA